MKIRQVIAIATIGLGLIVGCKTQQSKFAFLSPKSGENLTYGQQVAIKMQFPDTTIDSVVYTVDGELLEKRQDTSTVMLDTHKIGLGARNLVAKVYKSGKEEVAYSNIMILAETPQAYSFEKVNEYPHDITAFTQGLEFENGFLYESTGAGNQLTSSLRKVELASGKVLQKKELLGVDANNESYFGEGMTIVGDKIIMLTWLNKMGFVFNKNNFEQQSTFAYQDFKEGWGICYDGTYLIVTDSSSKLHFLDPNTFKEVKSISVYDNEGAVEAINELEYIDGKIYGNIYGKDIIIIINPETGVVEGRINFVGLYTNPNRKATDEEMNGIAYDRIGKRLFVTGKQWDKLFEVKIIAR